MCHKEKQLFDWWIYKGEAGESFIWLTDFLKAVQLIKQDEWLITENPQRWWKNKHSITRKKQLSLLLVQNLGDILDHLSVPLQRLQGWCLCEGTPAMWNKVREGSPVLLFAGHFHSPGRTGGDQWVTGGSGRASGSWQAGSLRLGIHLSQRAELRE